MKKHIGIWITAAILLCLGISLTVAGAASGAIQIIKNSDGLFDKVTGFIESKSIKKDQSVEIIDATGFEKEIQKIDIALEGYAVALKPTNKDEIQIKSKDIIGNDHPNIATTNNDGTLTITGVNKDDNFKNQVVEIYIPAKTSPDIIIESVNSAISVEDLSLTSLTCNSENAAISVEDVHCTSNVTLTTLNALISVEEVNAPTISIKTNTGIITFDSLHFDALDINNTIGAINGELESRALYTVNITRNGNTETSGTGSKTVNITKDTGVINLEYDD